MAQAKPTGRKRGRPRRPKPPALEALAGRKHLATLLKHRRRLRKAYDHPNRTLFYDTVLSAHLLAFYNPILRSLRTLEDFSQAPRVQDELDCEKICRSTLSDAHQVLDATLLEALIQDLHNRLPQLPRMDGKLSRLLKHLRIIDGSYFKVAAEVQWALRRRKRCSATIDERFVRLDLQLCCARGVPECIEINGQGSSEVAAARRHVERGVIYVADRGIFSFAWLAAMLEQKADFVLRIKTSQNTRTIREMPLSDADGAAGVLSDRIVVLEGGPYRPAPQGELREVRIADPNHPGHVLRLLTNLMDVEARILGEVYRHRWQIELFFRWLKVHAHFRHLISQDRNGIRMSFYVAVIGVLLLYLHSGRKPSLYAYNLLCLVAQGAATLADILPILANREREKQLARKRLLKKKLEKQGL